MTLIFLFLSFIEIDLLHPYFTQITLIILYSLFHVHSFQHLKDFEYLATDADNVVEGVCVICEEGVELIGVNIPRPGQRHVSALSSRSRQSH